MIRLVAVLLIATSCAHGPSRTGRVDAPTPQVRAVFPSPGDVPENILRFYIYFTEPMREGNFLQHIRLWDLETGEELTGAFFDNLYELWSPDRKRITVLVDPGRQKTGLAAHERLGRVFKPGRRYRLEVLPSWRSIAGIPLRTVYTHRFDATVEDRSRVDPGTWTLHLPPPLTSESLRVEFHERVDHVSAQRFLAVLDEGQNPVPGRWELFDGEREARFVPAKDWGTDLRDYSLLVSVRFEDVVGNNVNAAFEHSVTENIAAPRNRLYQRRFGPE